jgi:hypothetical protein
MAVAMGSRGWSVMVTSNSPSDLEPKIGPWSAAFALLKLTHKTNAPKIAWRMICFIVGKLKSNGCQTLKHCRAVPLVQHLLYAPEP